MLVPGELLTKPPPEPRRPKPPVSPSVPPPAPADVDDDVSDSFLMILLRALGAIHT
jgi:hypothetical protein